MATFDTQNHNEIGFSSQKKADELYQCRYCEAFFVPTKRFVQKYCRESCRVMDYKRRKTGIDNIQGAKSTKKESFSKKDANNKEQENIKKEVLQDIIPELKAVVSERDKVFEKKLSELSKKINWAIGISSYGAVATDSMKENVRDSFQNILQNISNTINNSELQQKSEKTNSGLAHPSKSKEQKTDNTKEGNSGEQK